MHTVICHHGHKLHTNTVRTIAGIPNAREGKLSMPQMMVVTNASMRKSCGGGWSEGGATTICDTCYNNIIIIIIISNFNVCINENSERERLGFLLLLINPIH